MFSSENWIPFETYCKFSFCETILGNKKCVTKGMSTINDKKFKAAAQAAAAFLSDADGGSKKLEMAPWLKKPAPAPSGDDPRKKMSF